MTLNYKTFTLGVEEEYMVLDPETRELKSHEQKIVLEGQKILKDKVKAEMEQLKNENEALLAKAREERAQLLKEARETRDKIVNEAKEQAKVEANKIITDAQLAITQQKMAAITEVKNQVGNLVIEVSEKVLRRELANKGDQEAYINNLAKEIKLN